MQLITKRDIIKQVVSKWEEVYSSGFYGDDKLEILEKLKKLDLNTVSAKKIESIIGNNTWTSLKCSECKKRANKVVLVDKDYHDDCNDYHSTTLCLNCAIKISNLLLKDSSKD